MSTTYVFKFDEVKDVRGTNTNVEYLLHWKGCPELVIIYIYIYIIQIIIYIYIYIMYTFI